MLPYFCRKYLIKLKIILVQVGKTSESYIRESVQLYEKRLKNYIVFETVTIPELKGTSAMTREQQKNAEGKLILDACPESSYFVLLDERGEEFTSPEFAGFVQKQILKGLKNLVFVIGGPYGFSDAVYNKANYKIALSKMTFSHQMVRLFFTEQLYRAFSILKNEPYHH